MNKIIFALAVIVGFIACLEASDSPSQKTTTIKVMLQERYEVLLKASNLLTAQYRTGMSDFNNVSQAVRNTTRAAVDLNPQDRVAALQAVLEVAILSEEVALNRFKSGMATEVDVLQAN